MKKVIYIYGLISGTIAAGYLLVTMEVLDVSSGNMENGMLIGYTGMVISLSLIFFAIKSLRDQSGGTITFWKATQVGLGIALIASVMYALSWEITYSRIGNEFNQRMVEQYSARIDAKNLPPEQAAKEKEAIVQSFESYKNPIVRFGFSVTEIFPVGLLITLISAALLRKKELLPATETIKQ